MTSLFEAVDKRIEKENSFKEKLMSLELNEKVILKGKYKNITLQRIK